MKTILISIFLFVMINCKGQSSDIIYIPEQKSLVVSYNIFQNLVGFYAGGYLTTSFPYPYIYTTPLSRLNRIGLNIGNGKFNFMWGGYVENISVDTVRYQPDLWLKIYPIRILTDTKEGLDFILAVNYMKGFRYGVGITIPFHGIYSR